MFTNVYQKIPGAIRQWFEDALFPARPVPVPVKVRTDEAVRHRPMSIQEYRNLKRRCKR
jgi:hypothetical protein